MSPKKFWLILKGTFAEFSEDNVLRLSAALAYYAIFSLGPLLVIVVGVVGLAFGHEHVRHQIQDQLKSTLGPDSARMIESLIASVSDPKGGMVAAISEVMDRELPPLFEALKDRGFIKKG